MAGKRARGGAPITAAEAGTAAAAAANSVFDLFAPGSARVEPVDGSSFAKPDCRS